MSFFAAVAVVVVAEVVSLFLLVVVLVVSLLPCPIMESRLNTDDMAFVPPICEKPSVA